MLLLRFLSGLPHGAYFGVAMLVAASLVPHEKRAQAAARVLMGLTVATIIGVPCANWLGQAIGWRWGFAIVAVLSLLTATLVALFAPHQPPEKGASPLTELAALEQPRRAVDPGHRRHRLWRSFRGLYLSRRHAC